MNNKPFESINEVQDVRVLIKVNGKHYSIVPDKDKFTDEEAQQMRMCMLRLLLECHCVVDTPLEDLKERIQELTK